MLITIGYTAPFSEVKVFFSWCSGSVSPGPNIAVKRAEKMWWAMRWYFEVEPGGCWWVAREGERPAKP